MDAIQKSLSNKIIGLLTETKRAMKISAVSVRLGVSPNSVGRTIRNLEEKGRVIFTLDGSYVLSEFKDYNLLKDGDMNRARMHVKDRMMTKAELNLCLEKVEELKAKIKTLTNKCISDDTGVALWVVKDIPNK